MSPYDFLIATKNDSSITLSIIFTCDKGNISDKCHKIESSSALFRLTTQD